MKKVKGFTLIELMVVIVILGILAAVVAPRIPDFVKKAKEGKTKGNLGTLRSSINIYYSDSDGVYPSDNLSVLVPKYVKEIPAMETAAFPNKATTANLGPSVTVKTTGDNDATGGWWYQPDNTNTLWGTVVTNANAKTDYAGNLWTAY